MGFSEKIRARVKEIAPKAVGRYNVDTGDMDKDDAAFMMATEVGDDIAGQIAQEAWAEPYTFTEIVDEVVEVITR